MGWLTAGRAASSRLLGDAARNTAWLYAAEALPRVGALVIVPIWSARVRPEEYANWVLALTSVELLLEFGGLGLGSYLTKVLYRYRDRRGEEYYVLGFALAIAATVVVATLAGAFSSWLAPVLIGGEVRNDLFVWLGLYLVLAQWTNLTLLYLGARIRYRPYFLLQSLRWLVNAGCLLFFLLGRDQGFYSWVWAAVIAEAVVASVAVRWLPLRWRFRRRMLDFALRFSLPSLSTSLLGWGQARVGRYVLSFAGLSAGVGLYGIAQNFATNYGAILRPAKIVAMRFMGRALEDDANSPYFVEFFHGFVSVALAVAMVTGLFLGDVMKLFVSGTYHGAAAAVPLLVFTLLAQEVYSVYHSLMFRYFKVWFHLVGVTIGFPVVTGATLLLVPRFGFIGAVIAQLAGALAMLVFAHRYTMSVTRRDFRVGEKIAFGAAGLALVVVAEMAALSLSAKGAVAIAALGGYGWLHWHRRHRLFPLLAARGRAPSQPAVLVGR